MRQGKSSLLAAILLVFTILTVQGSSLAGDKRQQSPMDPSGKRSQPDAAKQEPWNVMKQERNAFVDPFTRYLMGSLENYKRTNGPETARQSASRSSVSSSASPAPNLGGMLAAPAYDASVLDSVNAFNYFPTLGAIVAADFNGDGRPDMATYQVPGRLLVLLNQGNGTFGKPRVVATLPYGAPLTQLDAVDVNHDGYPDITGLDVYGDPYQTVPSRPGVWVFLNQKDGTFAPPTQVPTSENGPNRDFTSGMSSSVADIDRDGNPDVVVASSFYSADYTSVTVTVQSFLGNGDGTFRTGDSYSQSTVSPYSDATIEYGRSVGLADMNRDGKLDLVLQLRSQNYSVSPSLEKRVVTYLGNGDGTFQSGLWDGAALINNVDGLWTPSYPTPTTLTLLDLNGDDVIDMLLAPQDSGYKVYAAFGNGDGTFQPPITAQSDITTMDIDVADYNNDGKYDLIQQYLGYVNVYSGNGDGTFTGPVSKYSSTWFAATKRYFATADFDGDGWLDFATADSYENRIGVYLNARNPNVPEFKAAQALTDGGGRLRTWYIVNAVLDLNGDSLDDIIFRTAGNGGIGLLAGLSDGAGGLTYVPAIAPEWTDLDGALPETADFNRDGRKDILVANYGLPPQIGLSNGDGTITRLPELPALAGCLQLWPTVGDVNNDGKADLVYPNLPGDLCGQPNSVGAGYFVRFGNGDGTFQDAKHYTMGTNPTKVMLTDLNNDHNLDLVILEAVDIGIPVFSVSRMLGNGDGTFGPPVELLNKGRMAYSKVLAGDVNGDGEQDLVVLSVGEIRPEWMEWSPWAAETTLLLGNGDGTFAAPVVIARGDMTWDGILTDVNGDGALDLVTVPGSVPSDGTYLGGSVSLGFGDGTFAPPVNYSVVNGAFKVLAADFLKDGATDLVWAGSGTTFMLNQGGTTNALQISANPIGLGENVTFTTNLAATMNIVGRPVPSGSVTFFDGGTALGSGSVSDGVATFTTSALSAGFHNITARYNGDSSFNFSTSNPVGINVYAPPADVAVTVNPTSLSVVRGQSGQVTLSVAGNSTFNGSVQFQCSGLPAGTTCAFNPPSATVAAGQQLSVTLVIAASRSAGTTASFSGTTVATNTRPMRNRNEGILWNMAGMFGVAGVLVAWPKRRKLRRAFLSLGLLVVVLGSVVWMTSCGGGSSDQGVAPPTTSIVTITTTASSGGSTTTHTAPVILTLR